MMRSDMSKQIARPGMRRPGMGPDVTLPVMPPGPAPSTQTPPPNLAAMASKLSSQTPPMPANMPSSAGQSVPPPSMGSGGAPSQSAMRSALGFKKGGMVKKASSSGKASTVSTKGNGCCAKSKPCKMY